MENPFFDFLKTRKDILKKENAKVFHFVLGNESADLDSIVCSLVYAFYIQRRYEEQKKDDHHAIPVIWIDQSSLCLRTEVVTLFKKYSLNENDLIFKKDIDFDNYINNKQTELKITLVDHNHKTCHENITDYVYNIIDHHDESNDHGDNISKNINLVGSCSTLIGEEIYYNSRQLLDIKPIADFLLAAILVDTINLDLHAGRTKELDIFIAEVLSQFSTINCDELFNDLQQAKMNINMLSTYDIFRKDFKKVKSDHAEVYIGFSSATLPPLLLLERQDFINTANDFLITQNIKLLIICFLCYNDNAVIERYFYVYSQNKKIEETVLNQLNKHKEILQLENKDDLFHGLRKHGSQHSRKVILPLVKQFRLE